MKATKGKFVLGTNTYNWQATLDGVVGFGKTKLEAVKDVRERAYRELSELKEKARWDTGLAGDRYRAGRITIEQYKYLTKEWK